MYGFINTCLKSLVVEKYGEEIWEKLRVQTGVQDTFLNFEVYRDEITMQLIDKACKMLDVPPDMVLKQFGEYFFEFCKRSGYDHMLRTLGGNLYEFIENLDALHSYLSLSYQEMNAPSFRVEKNEDGSMHLHYYSDRRGLCHIVPGIIGAAALDFFNIEISMEIVNQSEEEERTGKKEHIVFLVTQKPVFSYRRKNKFSSSPQCLSSSGTLVEKQLNKEDLERAMNKTREKRNLLSTCPVKKSHWETIRGIVTIGKGRLLRGFDPIYPKTLCIDPKTFCNGLPFHIVFDEELRVKQAGVSIQKIVPGLQTMGIRLNQYFSIVRPEVKFTISSVQKFINSQFVFRTKREMMPESWKQHPMLELRGEFKECTILFSDVVTFTNICAQCEPIQIVLMLNAMYLRFDRLTTVHDVYKVETIGDAYMVVGGVPVPVSTHAERVANFALGMIIAAKDIKNPVSGNPIQIRVGIHTGPVLAGVVGEKMPRYCLFGDTVNIASRMESHGVPSKIHLSASVHQCLKDKNFEMMERGEIDVKGKGKMHTYFLVRNTMATEDEVLGRPTRDSVPSHESAQLCQECNTEAFQNSYPQDEASFPVIAMKYADSPIEAHTSMKGRNESRTQDLAGKLHDSESNVSLHGDQQSSKDPHHLTQGRRKPAAAEAPRIRNTRSSFCNLI
ncbi:guanylate cyclase soluble subunit beta-2-like isoform X2 [Rhineura floridana]|uniref:guanylate cyclase soluble subunit beta-2-like isoform X2 n=1 Tax=Rhineura floridana TaxID=261503 RepID=UPI002AC84DEE|nr:guanylate cyclase soluble subunit beta-2-like isoform X2 [Rhineura floridana]